MNEFTVNLSTAVWVNTRTNSLASHMILKSSGVKSESTPRVVGQAAVRPEESNDPHLSCSLTLSPSERVKGKCFPPSCAQPPIPSLFLVSSHHRAQPYNTIPLPSTHPISSSEKPHVQNQLSINIANDAFICNLLVYSSVFKKKRDRLSLIFPDNKSTSKSSMKCSRSRSS